MNLPAFIRSSQQDVYMSLTILRCTVNCRFRFADCPLIHCDTNLNKNFKHFYFCCNHAWARNILSRAMEKSRIMHMQPTKARIKLLVRTILVHHCLDCIISLLSYLFLKLQDTMASLANQTVAVCCTWSETRRQVFSRRGSFRTEHYRVCKHGT